jgi:hypothetical protein
VVLGDGDFSVAELRAELPESERVVLMSRCAKNRALYELPEAPEPSSSRRRGRRRKYGDRARKPEGWLAERSGWRKSRLWVRGRRFPARYRVEGPFVVKKAADRPVFLAVVKGIGRVRAGRRRTRKPAYWLVSAVWEKGRWDLPYPAEELLSWAWQRWEIEICRTHCHHKLQDVRLHAA